jgi:hypothetical protein
MTGPTLTIGSDARCDVQMRSAAVAPRHCLVSRQDGRVIATRLSADHPLLRNGQSIAEEELKDGDVLALGPFELRIEFVAQGLLVAGPSTPRSSEPAAVHRPRFALLDRKPTTSRLPCPDRATSHHESQTPLPAESSSAGTEAPAVDGPIDGSPLESHLLGEREARLREKDERLREWARRLDAQEADLERTRGELTTTLEQCQRRRQALEVRRARIARLRAGRRARHRELQSRFANLLGQAEGRSKELDDRDAELQRREERWRQVADAVEVRQAELEARERRTADAILDLERRRESLVRERGLLDNEWRRLFAKQQDVAQQQEAVARRADQIAAEETLLAESRKKSRAELRAIEELRTSAASKTADLDARNVKLRGRERRLDERAEHLGAVDRNLQTREAELGRQVEEIQRRAAEAQQRLDSQRYAIEERRADLEARIRQHDEEKAALQERQSAWKAEVAFLSRAKEELDQRTSLLAARERTLADLERKGHDPSELDRRYKELRREQDKLAADAAESAARRRKLEAETTRLAEIVRELSERQRELTERERRLAESAAREHEALDHEAERLQQQQSALDAQAEDRRRRWERLKSSAVRIGARRKVLLERLSDMESKFEECKREVEQLAESRRRLRTALEDYAVQTEQRERQALEWLRGVRAESESVADAHRRFTRQFDVAVGAAAPTSLRTSLADWWQRMAKLQRRLSNGEQALRSTAEVDAPATVEGPAEPTSVEEPVAILPISLLEPSASAVVAPPRWLFKLAELGLADDEVLNFLIVQARERKTTVEEALVEQGVVTRYQIDCVSQGRADALNIGPARVLDLVHEGTVARTYRAMIPPFEKAVALRLLHSNVAGNPAVKAAYLDCVQRAMRVRHPGVASVLGPFDHDGRIGVMTEFSAGRPLPAAAASMAPVDVMNAFRQCLAALTAGQRAGMIHGSLRPSRIMVSSFGRVVLLGFGEPDWLIRLHRCEKGPDADYYVAPEGLGGRPVDARADLFSLCRIFLEALLGRRPTAAESFPAPLGYPDAMLDLLVRGVRNDPAARCRTVADVIHEMDRWSSERLTPASAKSSTGPSRNAA